jgi:tRNA modification GTPase
MSALVKPSPPSPPPKVAAVSASSVSGPLASQAARPSAVVSLTPRHAHYGPFRDADGLVLDEGIALFFPGPNSFTGEDVLELQGHGGPVVLDMLLQRCLQLGCRLARPGEFSERAFLNDKLDLAQAEAIADLIEPVLHRRRAMPCARCRGVFQACA